MSIRTERVASQLQREIASILSQEYGEQLQPMVTVTGVRVTADLSIAYVYVSVLGDTEAQKNAAIGRLRDLTPRIRSSLASVVRHRMKSVPELKFFLDETQERAKRLDDLFGRIREERRHRGADTHEERPEES
jgi:ribosome-binding factor A